MHDVDIIHGSMPLIDLASPEKLSEEVVNEVIYPGIQVEKE